MSHWKSRTVEVERGGVERQVICNKIFFLTLIFLSQLNVKNVVDFVGMQQNAAAMSKSQDSQPNIGTETPEDANSSRKEDLREMHPSVYPFVFRLVSSLSHRRGASR